MFNFGIYFRVLHLSVSHQISEKMPYFRVSFQVYFSCRTEENNGELLIAAIPCSPA